MRKNYLWLLLLSIVFPSCDSLFEYHPYEGRIQGKTDILAKNVPLIESFGRGRHSFRFAFISDTQRFYDDTYDVVNHINARGDIDFVVHGGDLADFGTTAEFEWMRDELERLSMPYVTVIGNHDCLGTGEYIYEKMFGADNYSFSVGNTHFVMLNTVALENDYSNPVPDFGFIKEDIARVKQINSQTPDSLTHTVVVMHSRPGDEQFNNNVIDVFDLFLMPFPGLEKDAPCRADGTRLNGFCLNGHNHNRSIKDLLGDGIMYYGVPTVKKRKYYVFTIQEEGYEFEEVVF